MNPSRRGVPGSRIYPLLALLGFAAFGETITLPLDPTLSPGDGVGVCILRSRVDESADFLLKGNVLTLRAVHGVSPSDEGSACSVPLPTAPVGAFRLEHVQGRGRVLLVENPSGRNDFQAWVRIEEVPDHIGLFELRLSWQRQEGGGEGQRTQGDELILRPQGNPPVWSRSDGAGESMSLPGTRLSSFDNDPLRYDSQPTGQLEFRGRVDKVADFFIRRDQLNVLVESGQLVKVERFRFSQPLPSAPLNSIGVERKDGRGTVELIQKPDGSNDYTAIVRVSDPRSGSDRYHWVLVWSR